MKWRLLLIPVLLSAALLAALTLYFIQPGDHAASPARNLPSAQPATDSDTVHAHVRVVDLEGRPLRDMLPIATRQPNAFDPPIAKGTVTNANGEGYVTFPSTEDVCVRAWDPSLRMFANNYYDIPHNTGGRTPVMNIAMAPAAALQIVALAPNRIPAPNAPAELMLSHPARGPWWPARGETDTQGTVTFPSLPPGRYVLSLRVEGHGSIEFPEVNLPPGGMANLGVVVMQPAAP